MILTLGPQLGRGQGKKDMGKEWVKTKKKNGEGTKMLGLWKGNTLGTLIDELPFWGLIMF
jgi:hypothetical protein